MNHAHPEYGARRAMRIVCAIVLLVAAMPCFADTVRWNSKGQYFEVEGRELAACKSDKS